MAFGKLKNFDQILHESYDFNRNGMYWHIWVHADKKIGFRDYYKSYMGTVVEVVKKVSRGREVPFVFSVLNKRGTEIFPAHEDWFEYIQYESDNAIAPVSDVELRGREIERQLEEAARNANRNPESFGEILRKHLHKEIDVAVKKDDAWDSEAAAWDVGEIANEIPNEPQLSELSWEQLFDV